MTWSPLASDVTPGPTSTTMPAPSCPKITGKSPSGSAPERVNSSVWQMPVAFICTSTSPAFGPSSSTSSTTRSLPGSYATAARVLMASPWQTAYTDRRFAPPIVPVSKSSGDANSTERQRGAHGPGFELGFLTEDEQGDAGAEQHPARNGSDGRKIRGFACSPAGLFALGAAPVGVA